MTPEHKHTHTTKQPSLITASLGMTHRNHTSKPGQPENSNSNTGSMEGLAISSLAVERST